MVQIDVEDEKALSRNGLNGCHVEDGKTLSKGFLTLTRMYKMFSAMRLLRFEGLYLLQCAVLHYTKPNIIGLM